MPVLIFIVPVISVVLISSSDWFWSLNVADRISIFTSCITAAAFCATAWNAYEAKKSAKAAMKAVQITSDSLTEARKSSFEQWFKTLLEHHEKLLGQVKEELSSSTGEKIKNNLRVDFLHQVYDSVVMNQVFIRYVSNIVSILEYIDKGFYSPSSKIEEKKVYVEQLRHFITPDVMLIIAIFGINYYGETSHNSHKLKRLLNKYNFFEGDPVLNTTLITTSNGRLDVKNLFERDYRSLVREYIKHSIICTRYKNYSEKPEVSDVVRITNSILWSYKSPGGDLLRAEFNSLISNMEKEIEYYLEIANKELTKVDNTLNELIGYKLFSDSKLGKRSGLYVINDKEDAISLVKHYLKRVDRGICNIGPEHVYFNTINSTYNGKLGNTLNSKIDNYVFYSALLHLNNRASKPIILSKIFSGARNVIEKKKRNLDNLA
ncbi:TPA: hypothetical protein ACNE1U_004524 [Escherichia coli]|uniref:hypothetical protein n=2 Tax=Escherichia coli TaxID=562 RepID=UPI0002CAE949|nr:hypothetical protein [Escherichia coli]HBH6935220.1 hypothetical protein [Enterobacter cloacae]EFM3790714.1 hypothetical protein [Escherichia coli]EHH7696582.1 hypothetical protein [Escherichia coli]EHW2592243.1 hypothetical protein [Escherichia coli]EKG1108278.1 hypothetical protein [Escherichia coli]